MAKAKQITVYEKKMDSALATAEKMSVKSFEDAMDAADFLFDVKMVAEKLDEEKLNLTKPMNEALKAARKLFKKPEEAYTEAERLAKEKILDWHMSQWDKGVVTDNKISGLHGNVVVVERTRVVVEDADAVQREFCAPDMGKVEHALLAGIQVKGAKLEKYYTLNAGKN